MIFDPNPNPFPAPWAMAWGEDRHGLWQAFEIGGERQVMRWIVLGRFEMGSPPEEKGRFGDEVLHGVTLRRGYWLADTACTQALWQVVTGKNPAYFKDDPQNPVEQVSWDDCQGFIAQANQRLPDGPLLRLPTEAEWEYACRAGTRSAFWWGDGLTTEQANYTAKWDFDDEHRVGEYRQQTLPVLSFDPNPWGLYQMHGNVWEWCADWSDAYPAGPVSDPSGPASGHERVLRGGGWGSNGRFLRSARAFGCQARQDGDGRGPLRQDCARSPLSRNAGGSIPGTERVGSPVQIGHPPAIQRRVERISRMT